MFQRFTPSARQSVVLAQEDARARRQSTIRSENLLVCLYDPPGGADSAAAALLRAAGLDQTSVVAAIGQSRSAGEAAPDAAKLARLGIDLDEVRRQAEESFGPGALDRTRAGRRRGRSGHIPFAPDAKTALELSLRESVRLGHRHIGTEHLLLGLAQTRSGAAHHILAAAGLTPEGLRASVAGSGAGTGEQPG